MILLTKKASHFEAFFYLEITTYLFITLTVFIEVPEVI